MAAVQLLLEKKRLEFSKRMEECRGKQEELRAKVFSIAGIGFY